jgi:hypothetical protein
MSTEKRGRGGSKFANEITWDSQYMYVRRSVPGRELSKFIMLNPKVDFCTFYFMNTTNL